MLKISEREEALLLKATGQTSTEIFNSDFAKLTPDHDVNRESCERVKGSVSISLGRIFSAEDLAKWHDK